MPQSSAEPLEQVVEGDSRKQLELSVPQYEPGEWKYEFKMSSVTSTILNLLFTDAEQKGKTRNFRMYIGPGSDGSSADKLSLDLKFNLAIDEQDSLHAIRPIRNLVHMSERRVA